MFSTPILIIAFKRPETTRKLFNSIKKLKPKKLYLSVDAPRETHGIEEIELCNEVIKIFDDINWDCDFKLFKHKKNQGCKYGPVSAIDWFFENEVEGIILEDDILPLDSFYDFCKDLLDKYRYNNNIGLICGTNFVSNDYQINDSYCFSKLNHIWGWATWKRAWDKNNIDISNWPRIKKNNYLLQESAAGNKILFNKYWSYYFDKAYNNDIDAWDYQWLLSCWENNMLAILPKNSIVDNIGFDESATHTQLRPTFMENMNLKELDFPLMHPEIIERSIYCDYLIEMKIFKISKINVIKHTLKGLYENYR